jgi:hypothetical protein
MHELIEGVRRTGETAAGCQSILPGLPASGIVSGATQPPAPGLDQHPLVPVLPALLIGHSFAERQLKTPGYTVKAPVNQRKRVIFPAARRGRLRQISRHAQDRAGRIAEADSESIEFPDSMKYHPRYVTVPSTFHISLFIFFRTVTSVPATAGRDDSAKAPARRRFSADQTRCAQLLTMLYRATSSP